MGLKPGAMQTKNTSKSKNSSTNFNKLLRLSVGWYRDMDPGNSKHMGYLHPFTNPSLQTALGERSEKACLVVQARGGAVGRQILSPSVPLQLGEENRKTPIPMREGLNH